MATEQDAPDYGNNERVKTTVAKTHTQDSYTKRAKEEQKQQCRAHLTRTIQLLVIQASL